MTPAPADIAEPVAPVEIVAQQELPVETLALPDGIRLSVTEIFYQDAVNSMAVVNDLPVMVGSHVDAAVVTEILTDRVLFEIDGKVYSVSVPHP
jgi:general secretion pathway protein B